jgi:hypothetical protein
MVEIKEKITAGNHCLRALDNVLKARYIVRKIKIRVYKTTVKPVVSYGSEVWTITDKIASILMTWERKILRKIYGPKCENGVWQIRTNLELQNIYKDNNIISDIKTRRLEWLGHVVRMEDFRLAKKILNAKLDKKRQIVRPKLRWFYNVLTDIKTLGVKRWLYKAQDEQQWARMTREAKVKLRGLYCHRRRRRRRRRN